MIEKLKNGIYRFKFMSVGIEIFVVYRMVLNLIYSTEHPYETQKDLYFCYAAIWLTIIVAILGKVYLKKVTWISLCTGLIIAGIYFKIKEIGPSTYGPIYFKVIYLSWTVVIASLSITIAFLCAKSSKEFIKNNWIIFLLFLTVVACVLIYGGKAYAIVVSPIVALLMIGMSKERWNRFAVSFAIGYYLAFFQTMTKSLIENPDRYQDGRYLGSFMELESGGAFCGGAVVCALFLVALYIFSENKRWYKIAIPLVMLTYPIYAVIRITSRSTQIALILVLFCFFIFIHKSMYKKTTIIRSGIVIGAGIVLIAFMFALSVRINKRVEAEGYKGLSYWEEHLLQLTSKEGRTGTFRDGSIINAFDRLSSRRIGHWVGAIKQVRLLGHPIEPFSGMKGEGKGISPHNFFIQWLIEYGIIGGGLAIGWMLYLCIYSGKRVLCKDSGEILLFLWCIFSIGIFMCTCVRWKSPVSLTLLILQYAVYSKSGSLTVSED